MTSAGPQIIQETNITTEGGDGSLSACKSLVIYLRYHQNEKPAEIQSSTKARRRFDNLVPSATRLRMSLTSSVLRFADHVTKRNGGSGDENDVFTTSHMRRTLARGNFTSARRRRAISLSMLKGQMQRNLDNFSFVENPV